jgi:hypothetical protein
LVLHLFSVHWHGLSKKVDLHSVFYHLNHVFSLAEQYHPVIDNYKQLINVEVEAGHVEIVGYKHVAPAQAAVDIATARYACTNTT